MAYTFETRLVSARLFTKSLERCARLGISTNAAANYGLGVLIKAHQRQQLFSLGFSRNYFTCKDGGTGKKTQPTSLRIRHDYLDYIEMQGLIRNKIINYSVKYVCDLIEDGKMFASAVSDGPKGRGIAHRNVYTNGSTSGKEGQEP